ncbi:MAG TPA: nucleoside hydrolase [Streptosporangiaceae bacterium]|nr:nucleoside hydrolase [Streptosporangiaceae bacterium]
MTIRLLLDVDTGTDDAVAIMLAALHPDLELAAITTVNGNVPVKNCTDNTLRTLDFIGKASIPVYEGAAEPIARPDFPIPRATRGISEIHGEHLDIPDAVTAKADGIAANIILEEYREGGPGAGSTVLVATGPLTNVALALKLDPTLPARIPRLVIMGGGHEVPNVTPSAEFNIWADPEAAAVVLGSGIEEIILVPLDSTHRALISVEDCEAFRALGTPAGEATARFVQRRIEGYDATQPMARLGAAPVHDALCVAYLIDPAVIPIEKYWVDVETDGPLTVGRTVVDTHQRSGREPNVWVSLDADEKKFRDIMLAAFAAS